MSYYHIQLQDSDSTIIKELDFNDDSSELTIYFKDSYYIKKETYVGFTLDWWMTFSEQKSFGRFYLQQIKPNFKLKKENQMAKPKMVLKGSINVGKINKDHLFVSEKGNVYANVTIFVNEVTDAYGNIASMVQDVNKETYEKEKDLPNDQKTKLEFLANFKDFTGEGGVKEATAEQRKAAVDDLPF